MSWAMSGVNTAQQPPTMIQRLQRLHVTMRGSVVVSRGMMVPHGVQSLLP